MWVLTFTAQSNCMSSYHQEIIEIVKSEICNLRLLYIIIVVQVRVKYVT